MTNDEIAAIFALLSARRKFFGWNLKSLEDSTTDIVTWGRILIRHFKIPLEHFETLYYRAIEVRAVRLAEGMTCPDLTPDLIASGWFALRNEKKQQESTAKALLIPKYDACPDDFTELRKKAELKAKENRSGIQICPQCRIGNIYNSVCGRCGYLLKEAK